MKQYNSVLADLYFMVKLASSYEYKGGSALKRYYNFIIFVAQGEAMWYYL